MPDINNTQPEVAGQESKSLKEMSQGFFDSLKGPVLWIAIGYMACKFFDRKKRTVI